MAVVSRGAGPRDLPGIACLAVGLLVLAGCSDQGGPAPSDVVDQGDLRTYAAPSVSGLLDRGGLLSSGDLTRAAQQGQAPGALLDERTARVFAEVAAHRFGPMLRGYLERGHGGPIRIAALRVCGRSYFAQSPYQPLADAIASPARKQFGSWWIVGLCGATEGTQVSVAVSAFATDLRIEQGEIRFPNVFGNEFKIVGVPAGWDGAIPVSPERAIVMAGARSGRQVEAVPVLVGPDLRRAYPQAAAWRLSLGRASGPANPQYGGDALYVGVGGPLVGVPGVDAAAGILAPAPSAAKAVRLALPTTASLLRHGTSGGEDPVVDLIPRKDVPLQFITVGGN
jgi:hypothetical protein